MARLIIFLVSYTVLIPFYYLNIQMLEGFSLLFKYLPFLCILFVAVLGFLKDEIHINAENRIVLMFSVFVFVVSLISLTDSIFIFFGFAKFVYYSVTGLGFFVLLCIYRPDIRTNYRRVLIALVLVSSISSAYGICVYLTGVDWLWGPTSLFFSPYNGWMGRGDVIRPPFLFGNSLYAGSYFSMVLPFSILLFLHSKRVEQKILFALTCLLLVGGLIVSFARGAIIATFIVTILQFVFHMNGWEKAKKRIAISIVLSSLCVFALLFTYSDSILFERISDRFALLKDIQQHEPYRISQFYTTLEILKEEPFLGVGFGNFVRNYDELRFSSTPEGYNSKTTENMYLMTLCETGILGLAAFFTLIGSTVADMLKNRKIILSKYNRDYNYAIICSIVSCLIIMCTWDVLNQPSIRLLFWLVMGLGIKNISGLKR